MIPPQVNARTPKRIPHSLGFARYALRFNDVDQYGEIPDSVTLNISSKITLEALVFPTVLSAGHEMILLKGWTMGDRSYYLSLLNRRIFFTVRNPTDTDQADAQGWTPLNSNKMYHLVGVMDGSVASVYVNAELDATPKAWTEGIMVGVQPLRIGATWDGTTIKDHFGGLIVLARIYGEYALDADEIKWNSLNYHNPVRPDKLALWLSMEEGAGETVYDKSGHGNHGILLPAGAGPTWERLRQWELRSAVE